MKRKLLRNILALSIPAIMANIAAPVLSMTDMAIAGHMGGADVVAAVALGGVMFNLIYWLLGFLRMGASGLTAQAFGAGEKEECMAILARSLTISTTLGAILIALKHPLASLLIVLLDAPAEIAPIVRQYFEVCIWGAPAMISMYAFAGWSIGMQSTVLPMRVSLIMTIVNIIFSVSLVFMFHLGVRGVALGTCLAQWLGAVIYIISIAHRTRGIWPKVKRAFTLQKYKQFFNINADIFLRTLCMVFVTMWFTRVGAGYGALVLAANSLIMQFFTLFSFFMDGFAFAGEAMCGRFDGGGKTKLLTQTISLLFKTGIVMALTFTIIYVFGGDFILRLLSHDVHITSKAHEYLWWAATIPLAGFSAFICDGVAIGLVRTRLMLYSLMVATVIFFATYLSLQSHLGNHALWLAFVLYLAARGVFLYATIRKLPQLR